MTAGEPAPHVTRGLPRTLPVALALELTALGATFPVLPDFVGQLGGGPALATLCFALTAAPKLPLQPLWGGWSDRLGRRPILAIGMGATAACYLAWGVAPAAGALGLWVLLGSRAFYGFFGNQLTVASAVVGDCMRPEDRARGMGILGATAGLGFVVGPALGGWLGGAHGPAAVGWLGLGLESAGLVLVLAMPETSPRRPQAVRRAAASPAAWGRALAHAVTGRVLWATLPAATAIAVVHTTFRLVVDERLGWSLERTGAALAGFALLGVAIQGGAVRPLVARLGEKAVSQAGLALTAAGAGLLVPTLEAWAAWTALGLLAVGMSLAVPAMSGLLSRATAPEDQGAVQGMNQGVTGLGRTLNGAAMGLLFQGIAPGAPFAAAAGCALAAMVVLGMAPERPERPLALDAAGGAHGDSEQG